MSKLLTRKAVEPVPTDPQQGLTAREAQLRLDSGWSNRVTVKQGRTEGEIILENTLTFFNFVFVVMAVVLALCGSSVKNMTFMIVVVINTVIGIFQQIRAKRAVDKLTLVAAQTVKTIRDGEAVSVRSDLLVRDDIVEFSAGDQICADGILCTGQLQVNESLITGEADAIVKDPGDELKSGSFVVAGRGRVRLTHVGDDAFAARLSAEAKKDPQAAKSEMMNSLDKLIRVVGIALVPVGLILFYQQFQVLELSLRESAEAVVAALVGMIPEGLYLLTSVAMAASALKLTGQRVLVQDLNCIETLARVDVLCVDKTGTITEPVMAVEEVLPLENTSPEKLEEILTALYGSEEPENDTGKALAQRFGGRVDWVCRKHIPFTSETKWGGGVFDRGSFLVGAPEFILGSRYKEIQAAVEERSAIGYRVLLVAGYEGDPVPGKLEPDKVQCLGLVLLTSRIRPEAPKTFTYFKEQGVTIKVISGDNPATVAEVARRAGIENAHKYIDAGVLETEADFLRASEAYTVFGRVTPDKKKRLIQAMKKQRHTVAMTGDGVNDVLAMKASDCSIAMASGAQAASQVSRLVLLDSDFSAMPGIVGEGRRVINNIQRSATLFLVKNIFSMGLALLSLVTGWAYPLAPLHLTVISTLTIGTPAFFLALEPNYEMVRGRFLTGVLRRALPGGVTNIVTVLAAQGVMNGLGLPLDQIRTVCTAILAAVGLMVLFQTSKPFGLFRKIIWCAMAAGLVLCFTVLPGFFGLHVTGLKTLLVMAGALAAAPLVFFLIQRLFDLGDRWAAKRKK